jgi:MoxR-like ATPase
MADLIEAGQVRQVAGKKQVLELVEEARKVYVSAPVRQYIVDLVTGLRKNHALLEGPSTRASIWMMKAGRAHALISGRSYVIPDDVKAVAPHVLRHRLQLRREIVEEVSEEQVVEEILSITPVPKG